MFRFRFLYLGNILAILYMAATIGTANAARKAFVVGISNYSAVDLLTNPTRDAEAIRDKLEDYDFTVTYVPETNATLIKLKTSWNNFVKSLRRNDDVVVYYSGHGISVNGLTYFAAKDFDPDAISEQTPIDNAFLGLSKMLQAVAQTFPSSVVWIIDACRDNDLQIPGKQKGLSYYKFGVNHAALYSAAEGEASFDHYPPDSQDQKNSVFTKALLDILVRDRNADIYYVAGQINKRVSAATQNKQHPGSYLNMNVDWCFGKCAAAATSMAFENGARIVVAENTSQLSAKKAVVRRSIARNAIFLGRKSAASPCAEDQGYLHPFGCKVLNDLAIGQTRNWINVPLKATWPVYRRYRAPTVIGHKLLNNTLSCKVGSVIPDETIEVAAILSINYEARNPPDAKDTFYWGLLPEGKPCPPQHVEKDLVAKITRIIQP